MNQESKINDFVIRFANVNGTGSASANALFTKAVFRMGVPVTPKNIFPSNIQGLPTWYEVRVSEKGHLGRREPASECLQRLREIFPEPTVIAVMLDVTGGMSPELAARIAEGLRKAGLPEE